MYQRLHEMRRAAVDQTYAERQQFKAPFADWDARDSAWNWTAKVPSGTRRCTGSGRGGRAAQR
ncbi:hypothetical protein ACWD4J_33985 [Streptomyces sp. NPDC002577]